MIKTFKNAPPSRMGAIEFDNEEKILRIHLEWHKEISGSDFMERIKKLPKTKAFSFLTKE